MKTSLKSCLATMIKAGKMFGVVKDYLRWRDSSRLTCYKCLGIDKPVIGEQWTVKERKRLS